MTATLARRAGAITLTAATMLALAGCGGVGAKLTYDDTEKGKVTSIVIDGGSGDVQVTTAAITETHITRIYRVSADPDESYRLDGTVLHISNRCGHNCQVSYQIEAPAGVGVSGELTSGDVQLTDVGATDLKLTSGDVMIRGATGKVSVKATSGDVTITDAKAGVNLSVTSGDAHAINITGPVVAKVTSGDATVKLSKPASVTAEADSGDLVVTVPTGAYQVHTHKGSGDLAMAGITDDPKAQNILDLRVGSGDLTVAAA
jgi:Putative adhesin